VIRVDPSGTRVIMHSKPDARNGVGDSADVVIPSEARNLLVPRLCPFTSQMPPWPAAFGLPGAAAAGLLHALTKAERTALAAGLAWLGGWRSKPSPVISDALPVTAH